MTSAFDSVFSEVMAELEKQRESLAELHKGLNEVNATVRSKRRQVSATVDGRGEIVELKFHGETFRTMPAPDLAKLIVDTIRQAKEEARSQSWESIGEALPDGAEIADVVSGDYDWSNALNEAMTLPEPLMDFLTRTREELFEGGVGGVAPPESPPNDNGNGANGHGNDAGNHSPNGHSPNGHSSNGRSSNGNGSNGEGDGDSRGPDSRRN
jgi:DNA-binding protein YbaB